MRARSKTNSRPRENLKLRASYAKAHPICELGIHLPEQFSAGPSGETHHIMTGKADLVSNLLRVSWTNHLWLERLKTDGRIAALWVKHQKEELDPGEFHSASRFLLPGWLLKVSAREPWCVSLLEELRRLYP